MPYYDLYRQYCVNAESPIEMKVKFSRALENHEEDQYYVKTIHGKLSDRQELTVVHKKHTSMVLRILMITVALFGWIFQGAIEQFTYTSPKQKPKNYSKHEYYKRY